MVNIDDRRSRRRPLQGQRRGARRLDERFQQGAGRSRPGSSRTSTRSSRSSRRRTARNLQRSGAGDRWADVRSGKGSCPVLTGLEQRYFFGRFCQKKKAIVPIRARAILSTSSSTIRRSRSAAQIWTPCTDGRLSFTNGRPNSPCSPPCGELVHQVQVIGPDRRHDPGLARTPTRVARGLSTLNLHPQCDKLSISPFSNTRPVRSWSCVPSPRDSHLDRFSFRVIFPRDA